MGELLRLIAVGCLSLSCACSQSQPDQANRTSAAALQENAPVSRFPDLTGRVVDAANVLAPEQERYLTQRWAALEARTGHQLVIVSVPSLGGEDIATFTSDLATHWGIGRGNNGQGVVILVAPNDGRVRIAVGYGLEHILTDGISRRIITDRVLPRFREGNMPAGIRAGAGAVVDQLQ